MTGPGGWRTSSLCTSAGCVEVDTSSPAVVRIRDSKDPARPGLTLDRQQWADFKAALRRGEFDPPAPYLVPDDVAARMEDVNGGTLPGGFARYPQQAPWRTLRLLDREYTCWRNEGGGWRTELSSSAGFNSTVRVEPSD